MTKTIKTTAKTDKTSNERNGIRPPTRVGTVLTIWTCFEETPGLTTEGLPALAEQYGWSLGLTRSWFRQWRQWHGLPTTTAKAKKVAR